MAAANPYIKVVEKNTGAVVAGLTDAVLLNNGPDRRMFNSSVAIHWNDTNPFVANPILMATAGFELQASGPINGGNGGSFIEVELYYKKVPRFDATSK